MSDGALYASYERRLKALQSEETEILKLLEQIKLQLYRYYIEDLHLTTIENNCPFSTSIKKDFKINDMKVDDEDVEKINQITLHLDTARVQSDEYHAEVEEEDSD